MNVSFIGRLTTVPELSKTKTTGNDVAKSSVAVSSNGHMDTATNTYVSDSSFYNIEAYKGTAARLAKYPKGTLVHIEGDLTNVSYKAADWTNKSYLKIVVNSISAVKYLKDDELGLGTQTPNTAAVASTPAAVATPAPVTTPVSQVTPGTENPLNPSDEPVSFDFSQVQ